MFEVEYLCDEWVKKDGVNGNLVLWDWPNFEYPIDFSFSPRLRGTKQNHITTTVDEILQSRSVNDRRVLNSGILIKKDVSLIQR